MPHEPPHRDEGPAPEPPARAWLKPTLTLIGRVERITQAKELNMPSDGQTFLGQPVSS